MYFFKHRGKQYLDLSGDLILTNNDRLVKARATSAAPHKVLNASYVSNAGINLLGKIKATTLCLRFIWTDRFKALGPEDTNLKQPHTNDKQAGE